MTDYKTLEDIDAAFDAWRKAGGTGLSPHPAYTAEQWHALTQEYRDRLMELLATEPVRASKRGA